MNPDDLDTVRIVLEEVRKEFFQKGEMKYHNLRNNRDIKLFQIITKINKLPFFIISFVTDKRRIYEESGLRYKKAFIKFLNNMLYK